jgi:hypothetical protein
LQHNLVHLRIKTTNSFRTLRFKISENMP